MIWCCREFNILPVVETAEQQYREPLPDLGQCHTRPAHGVPSRPAAEDDQNGKYVLTHLSYYTCLTSLLLSQSCSSMVERWLIARWVVRSSPHGRHIELLFLFFSQCSTTGVTEALMYYPVSGMVHIKEPLLLVVKSSPWGGSRFPISLSEWSFTICLTPYNRKIKCVECVVK